MALSPWHRAVNSAVHSRSKPRTLHQRRHPAARPAPASPCRPPRPLHQHAMHGTRGAGRPSAASAMRPRPAGRIRRDRRSFMPPSAETGAGPGRHAGSRSHAKARREASVGCSSRVSGAACAGRVVFDAGLTPVVLRLAHKHQASSTDIPPKGPPDARLQPTQLQGSEDQGGIRPWRVRKRAEIIAASLPNTSLATIFSTYHFWREPFLSWLGEHAGSGSLSPDGKTALADHPLPEAQPGRITSGVRRGARHRRGWIRHGSTCARQSLPQVLPIFLPSHQKEIERPPRRGLLGRPGLHEPDRWPLYPPPRNG